MINKSHNGRVTAFAIAWALTVVAGVQATAPVGLEATGHDSRIDLG